MRLVIDFEALWHRLCRASWQAPILIGWKLDLIRSGNVCHDCGKSLTPDEKTYYEVHCERCEGIFSRLLGGL